MNGSVCQYNSAPPPSPSACMGVGAKNHLGGPRGAHHTWRSGGTCHGTGDGGQGGRGGPGRGEVHEPAVLQADGHQAHGHQQVAPRHPSALPTLPSTEHAAPRGTACPMQLASRVLHAGVLAPPMGLPAALPDGRPSRCCQKRVGSQRQGRGSSTRCHLLCSPRPTLSWRPFAAGRGGGLCSHNILEKWGGVQVSPGCPHLF